MHAFCLWSMQLEEMLSLEVKQHFCSWLAILGVCGGSSCCVCWHFDVVFCGLHFEVINVAQQLSFNILKFLFFQTKIRHLFEEVAKFDIDLFCGYKWVSAKLG